MLGGKGKKPFSVGLETKRQKQDVAFYLWVVLFLQQLWKDEETSRKQNSTIACSGDV